ncbi:protein phosphatase 1 regulatory subunit 35 [Pseudochaenichthys georgianus]|uniref:protein phosphatase 1 regulatory subunit 35 n=1 Tax=Pseudochaenichthys georgianus TaxID=52239 RepID=UPI00146CCAFD|nr:protein phosphatase 1 regulatory subunit 35 [Pseudochaenichthys georgianus]
MSSSNSTPSSPLPLPQPLPYSFPLTRCPELDLSVTLSPAPKTNHTHRRPSQQSDKSQFKPGLKKQVGRQGNIQVCFEDQRIDATAGNQRSEEEQRMSTRVETHAPPQQPIRGQRRSKGCHQGVAPRQRVTPPSTVSNQDPGYLERPALNTTLALKAELQSLKEAEFNSQKAVQETLERSEWTKVLINTRATEEVNVSRSQRLFTSLVCVEVQEDQLISQVLPHRVLQPPCTGNRAAEGPSLHLFMTSDHIRQKPVQQEELPVNYKSRPSTCPASSTFDLYKRGRC